MSLQECTIAGLHEHLAQRVAGLPRSTRILDVGCGTGAWLARLHRIGFTDLAGCDYVQPTPIEGIDLFRADIDRGELSAFDRPFDLITCIEVIEHLENPASVLALAARALTPAGMLLVTTPNVHSLRARMKYLLTGKMPSFDEKGEPTHISPLFLPLLERLATRHGLRILRAWTYPENRTLVFGPPIRALSAMARMALPDALPGDMLCVTMVRATNREASS